MNDNKRISLSERVSSLYKQYLQFVNRIYFREVTAQEQGIELYNMLQKHMQIERNVKDLDAEIEELHSYVTMIEQQKQSRNIELLTVIGALFILPTFLISYIGIIILPNLTDKQAALNHHAWLILLPLLLGPLIYIFIAKKRNKKRDLRLLLFLYGIVIFTFILAQLYATYFVKN
jgi:Mg2+ and Co2+ transporter CorA